jgi:SAM-dependent methyltransferase
VKSFVNYLSQVFYPDPVGIDPVVRMLKLVEQRIGSESVILDVGAGAGHLNPYNFKQHCKKMVGVDMDPRVRDNELLHEGIVHNGASLPFEDSMFDVVFSVYVAEHVGDPEQFLTEIRRVLKPEGLYFQVTPNRFHYVPLIAALTPHWFHEWINGRRGRSEGDTFPTFYRMNDIRTIQRLSRIVGFEVVENLAIECRPNYLMFLWPAFLIGVVYERLVNCTELLRDLRVNLVSVLKKKP